MTHLRRAAFLFSLLGAGAAPAFAATIHVPADQPTIQTGILAASPGDTVEVACGTYAERDILVRPGIVLTSATGEPDCVTLEGDRVGRLLFGVGLAEGSVIRGFTFTGGESGPEFPGGAIALGASSPRIERCVFDDNRAFGGGALFFLDSSPEIAECVFANNRATGSDDPWGGGALTATNSDLRITDCEFVLNSAHSGGALQLRTSTAVITSCTFRENTSSARHAQRGGGALYLEDCPSVALLDCLLQENAAHRGGGLAALRSSVSITETTIQGHTVLFEGGGLFSASSFISMERSFVRHNVAGLGGGLMGDGGTVELSTSVFERNSSTPWPGPDRGGALYLRGAEVAVASCTFAANAAAHGSAAYLLGSTGFSATACVFAFQSLGVPLFFNRSPNRSLACCDIFGNEAGDWVGPIADQADLHANFSADPLFCDLAGTDLTIRSGSPCEPPGITGCGLVGALPVGCGPIPVDDWSWGAIKGRYRTSR